MKMEIKMQPLIQKDFGEKYDCDCTLVAMTMLLNYSAKRRDVTCQQIYGFVLKEAMKYFYDSQKRGSIPIFNKKILAAGAKFVNNKQKAYSAYLKDWKLITENIRRFRPMVLNFAHAEGYGAHSVVIFGFSEGEDGSKLLKIYDNHSLEPKYLDFSKISPLCSIDYLK